jgi:hypothetical protein
LGLYTEDEVNTAVYGGYDDYSYGSGYSSYGYDYSSSSSYDYYYSGSDYYYDYVPLPYFYLLPSDMDITEYFSTYPQM